MAKSSVRPSSMGHLTVPRTDMGEKSLGRLNVVSLHGYGVLTEAQRWQVILR